jgi:two-component sensor histidine kinase
MSASSSRQFWIVQTALWVGYGVEHFLEDLGRGRSVDIYRLELFDSFCGFVLTVFIRAVLKATWNQPLRARVRAGALALVLASLAGGYIWAMAVHSLCPECTLPRNYLGYLSYFFGWIYLLLAWIGGYVGIKLARQLREEKETSLRATAMAHQAQLRMLRYQLNPHFLFNTLNAISTLILDNRREQANGMVGALSQFLRYSLDSDPEQRVTLSQEIETIRRYLGIEQVRFGERLRVGIMVTPPAGTARVPSLILQPLIENAIKYAVSRREEGGRIEIVANVEDDMLDVRLRDDGPGSPDYRPTPGSSNGSGVGLANTRERLHVLYGDRHQFTIRSLEPHGTEVQLRIPFERLQPQGDGDAPSHPDRR